MANGDCRLPPSCCYILLAVVLVPANAAPEYNFRSEKGAVTALSAIFLAMGGGFAFASFFISHDQNNRQKYFWLLTAVAIGLLSLDELLGFHERLGSYLKIAVSNEKSHGDLPQLE